MRLRLWAGPGHSLKGPDKEYLGAKDTRGCLRASVYGDPAAFCVCVCGWSLCGGGLYTCQYKCTCLCTLHTCVHVTEMEPSDTVPQRLSGVRREPAGFCSGQASWGTRSQQGRMRGITSAIVSRLPGLKCAQVPPGLNSLPSFRKGRRAEIRLTAAAYKPFYLVPAPQRWEVWSPGDGDRECQSRGEHSSS